MRRMFILCGTAVCACTALRNYERATAQFGDAATAGVSATRGVVGAAHETCLMRASFHALEDRFQFPDFRRGVDPLSLSSDLPKPGETGTLTWGEYCGELAEYDKAFAGALTALEAYAAALKNVATGNGIALDTDLTAAFAKDAADLAKKLGASSLGRANELSGPLTTLANVVLDLLKTRQLRDAVIAADQPVSTILRAMNQYLEAAKDQWQDADHLVGDISRTADESIPVRGHGGAVPSDLAGQALALYEFSRLERARLDTLSEQLTATGSLLDALSGAHTQLVRGAHANTLEADLRASIDAEVETIARQVNTLRNLKG